MRRVDEVIQFHMTSNNFRVHGFEKALCNCLSSSESCELLISAIYEHTQLRDDALAKVVSDIEREFEHCHTILLDKLLSSFEDATYRLKQSIGFALSRLSKNVPEALCRQIQILFLSSPLVSVRRRGYSIAAESKTLVYSAIENGWRIYNDPEALWIITTTFPVSYLLEYRVEIGEKLEEGWKLARLYSRIAETEPNTLSYLKEIDPITYCYVIAKKGFHISDDEAFQLFKVIPRDERVGIFIWALGVIGKWNVLKQIHSDLAHEHEFE